jgi:pyrroloquinoline quinone (PQQ) biosynthesis protein C
MAVSARSFAWTDIDTYGNWLCQSYYYVSWTTRQLALASARTRPGIEDDYHWRFIEEANEEKRHEILVLNDLKFLGISLQDYPELPHTSFFYQSLNYMIEREHPLAIIGFALTLEGFAALKAGEFIPLVQDFYGEGACSFLRLHGELDVEHFQQALPFLEKCPTHILPIVSRSIHLCRTIYC